MNIMIDLIGSAMIAGLLILMMITFQYQLRDTAQRTLYTATMVDHMDLACTKINKVIAMAGVGMPADSAVVVAEPSRLIFRTYWSYPENQLTDNVHSIMLRLASTGTDFGRTLIIAQDGVTIHDADYIFYISDVSFIYYNLAGQVTTTPRQVRSVDARLTFTRAAPLASERNIETRIQIRCFIMNSYLKGG